MAHPLVDDVRRTGPALSVGLISADLMALGADVARLRGRRDPAGALRRDGRPLRADADRRPALHQGREDGDDEGRAPDGAGAARVAGRLRGRRRGHHHDSPGCVRASAPRAAGARLDGAPRPPGPDRRPRPRAESGDARGRARPVPRRPRDGDARGHQSRMGRAGLHPRHPRPDRGGAPEDRRRGARHPDRRGRRHHAPQHRRARRARRGRRGHRQRGVRRRREGEHRRDDARAESTGTRERPFDGLRAGSPGSAKAEIDDQPME